MGSTDELRLGSVVIDRDGGSSDEAVVVNLPPAEASEWNVTGRGTVADDNPDYPPEEQIAIAVFKPRLEESYYYYSGVRPLPLSELAERGVPHYAFPRSRLNPIGRYGPHELQLSRILPSPYHSRSFDPAANEGFIQRTLDRGKPHYPPLVRPLERGFEILNGHKRVWASHLAGLDRIPCLVVYLDDWQAAQTFANNHLSSYGAGAREQAVAALRERWSERAEQLKGVDPVGDAENSTAADGGAA